MARLTFSAHGAQGTIGSRHDSSRSTLCFLRPLRPYTSRLKVRSQHTFPRARDSFTEEPHSCPWSAATLPAASGAARRRALCDNNGTGLKLRAPPVGCGGVACDCQLGRVVARFWDVRLSKTGTAMAETAGTVAARPPLPPRFC